MYGLYLALFLINFKITADIAMRIDQNLIIFDFGDKMRTDFDLLGYRELFFSKQLKLLAVYTAEAVLKKNQLKNCGY